MGFKGGSQGQGSLLDKVVKDPNLKDDQKRNQDLLDLRTEWLKPTIIPGGELSVS